MKIIYKCLVFVCMLVTTYDSYAQKMVQTPRDIFLLCQNDGEFLGKSLKNLIDQIEPTVGMVFADGGWVEVAPRFSFYFMSKQEFDSCRSKGNLPLRLTVYTKEFFEWDYSIRKNYVSLPWKWVQEDVEQFGYLTVALIKVSGECQPNL